MIKCLMTIVCMWNGTENARRQLKSDPHIWKKKQTTTTQIEVNE